MKDDLFDRVFPALGNPRPFFQASIDRLLERAHRNMREVIGGDVAVDVTRSGLADAQTSRRPSGSYRVLVHDGLLRLMHDVVEIFLARTEITSAVGEVVTPVDLAHEDAAEILKYLVEQYVEHQEWAASIEILKMKADRRIGALKNERTATKLSLPYLRFMADFTMAHELAHVVLGHVDRPAPRSREQLWEEEYEADGAGLLFVKSWIVKEIHSTDEATNHAMIRLQYAELHVSLAILFEILALIVLVADKHGKNWGKSHPPGDARYQRLRAKQIESGLPEWAFSRPAAGMSAPDHVHAIVHALAMDVMP